MVKSISIIILAKDVEDLLSKLLKSLAWATEIIVVDDGSSDNTVTVAKKLGAKIVEGKGLDYSGRRNLGAEKSNSKWLMYLDTDEKVSNDLKKEIQRTILDSKSISAYAIPRKNILLGREMKHGGWWPDYVLRLIKKEKLVTWQGELHEQPKIKGEVGKLKNYLIHRSHRSLTEMVEKTNKWSEIEARLLFKNNHPKVVWWRFFSVAFREFWYRGVLKLGFLDGPIGIIEIIYQMYSRMITYAKLWEMQIVNKK